VLDWRVPVWSRLLSLGVLGFGYWLAGGAALNQGGSARWWAPLFAAFATFVTWRAVGLRVRAEGEELSVRNGTRTVRLARSEITGFRVGTGRRAGSRMVVADRRDGPAVGLDVTTEVPLAGGRERLQRRVAALEAWRRGTPAEVG
jgi:hypothetical protein